MTTIIRRDPMPADGREAAWRMGASLIPISASLSKSAMFASSPAAGGMSKTAEDASTDTHTLAHAPIRAAAGGAASALPASAEGMHAGAEKPAFTPPTETAASGRGAPGRVVSLNLCTDQLAMMLAAPGQLISVSHLASDPRSSAMVAEAAQYPQNHGLAEEIVLLRPDLVLAGRYGSAATTALLRRIGVPVEVFDPETSFAGIRDNLRRMGAALGREAEAERLVNRFDANLAALDQPSADRRRAAIYYANGYTAGDASLAGEILSAAGLANIASELGMRGGGMLSLEQLVLADPDLLIRGERYAGSSRAEDLLDHPALAALAGTAKGALADSDWVCGTPHVIDAVRRLRAGAEP
ncbi:cobalamin ABC transporter substrate-binding protein [Haematobacter massiliensis]|uniref:Cobalamin ABC transporter substrate-binding protein n=1 Tax=Haematobacter massiliensis TaxID=195105 RepID=A0A086Y809_9RHOB|nr:ABC transporter substrate-binding protein [Haematobacter massiliensis]KFI30409.1 cobalamin ABC transporter substrate-binding protein [Haematobacter massiliensis]